MPDLLLPFLMGAAGMIVFYWVICRAARAEERDRAREHRQHMIERTYFPRRGSKANPPVLKRRKDDREK